MKASQCACSSINVTQYSSAQSFSFLSKAFFYLCDYIIQESVFVLRLLVYSVMYAVADLSSRFFPIQRLLVSGFYTEFHLVILSFYMGILFPL